MEGVWQPDEASLAQILTILRDSHNPDTAVQRSVQQVLWAPFGACVYVCVLAGGMDLVCACVYVRLMSPQFVIFSVTSPQRLEELSRYPDFARYLLFVLSKLKQVGECTCVWVKGTVSLGDILPLKYHFFEAHISPWSYRFTSKLCVLCIHIHTCTYPHTGLNM